MPPFNFGEIKIDVGGLSSQSRSESEEPFRVLLFGNFSGRASRNRQKPLTARKPVVIDRDNFDEVLSGFHPELRLDLGNEQAVVVEFSALDDFHPDRLLERVRIFRRLRELRARLENPHTFEAAAEELALRKKAGTPDKSSASERDVSVAASVSRVASGSLLDEMVEQTEARGAKRAPPEDELQKFVRRVTEPHLVPAADPKQEEILGLIDRALGAQMRALLHVPEFQALEAIWRAALLLVRRIETDELLKVYLVDLSMGELSEDLNSSPDLSSTGTYRLLVEDPITSMGGKPWALVAGNYAFGPSREDAELAGRLAKIAHVAEAPFLAAGSPRMLGCDSFSTTPDARDWHLPSDTEGTSAWSAMRGLPEANAVGLILPRFLLRLPYGKNTDPIESFGFEEMPEEPEHDDYLWGNPAFACALLLAQSFSESGWDLRPGQRPELDRLPVHVYPHDGASEMKPCAEALMTVDAAERIMERGLMPLASLKGQDAVRLVRFQSIAQPLRALAGRWIR
jgi:type VI secretion system protein ImpC